MTSASDRPRMQLLDYERSGEGPLIGKDKIRLPNQLEISDIAIFEKDGRHWTRLLAEPIREATGQPVTNHRGKLRYRSPLRWATHDLQDRFSTALIELGKAEHDPFYGSTP